MTTTLNFKPIIDLPSWRPESPTLAAGVTGGSFANDLRNDATRHPHAYYFRGSVNLDFFDPIVGEWSTTNFGGLTAGTFGTGSCCAFHPSQGPRGTIAAGATTTSVVLSTALLQAPGVNAMANRGDGVGYRIRIVGLTSGLINERTIIANTTTTTPTITVTPAFSFTPAAGDIYEILSGRIYILNGGAAATGNFKYYDLATTGTSAALAFSGLGTGGGDAQMIPLSELHVPVDRAPGTGFVNGGATYDTSGNTLNCILATASSSTTVTGSGMLTSLVANEYTNFQVRIVEDTTTPAAVGQRRRISSHTAGATGVFTVAAFATTPSSTCKFVIENDDDKIMLKTNSTSVYNYNVAANTWDTTTWAAGGGGSSNGACFVQPFGLVRNDVAQNTVRHSQIMSMPAGGSSIQIDQFDISASSTGTWTSNVPYASNGQTPGSGSSWVYDPATNGGKYVYGILSGTQRMMRIDIRNRNWLPFTTLRYPQGAGQGGRKIWNHLFVDGTTKLNFVYTQIQSGTQVLSIPTPLG